MFSARPDVLHRCYTFSGAGQTHATVTSQGHRVGVGGVHVGLAVGQFHGDHPGLVVGTNPLVGLDEGRVQDRLLETQTHRNNQVWFGGSLYRRLSGQLSGLLWYLIKHLEKLHKLHLMTEVKLQINLQNRPWNKSTLVDISFEINSFVLLICL